MVSRSWEYQPSINPLGSEANASRDLDGCPNPEKGPAAALKIISLDEATLTTYCASKNAALSEELGHSGHSVSIRRRWFCCARFKASLIQAS
jgi:hypothetical protein